MNLLPCVQLIRNKKALDVFGISHIRTNNGNPVTNKKAKTYVLPCINYNSRNKKAKTYVGLVFYA